MIGEIVLLLAVVLLMAVICTLVGVLLQRDNNDDLKQSRSERYWWNVQLVDVQTGRRMGKMFQNRLILGRTLTSQEPMRLLFVGGQQTISRSQCEIIERREGLMIHNLSSVNITRHNGVPLRETQQLSQGDWLEMGGNRYFLERIDRVA